MFVLTDPSAGQASNDMPVLDFLGRVFGMETAILKGTDKDD